MHLRNPQAIRCKYNNMENKINHNVSELFQSLDLKATPPEEIIKHIMQLPSWFSYVNERLSYKEYEQPSDSEETLDMLIAWYLNKKSKKVKYAGTKLRKVFLELPPVEQRKVGLALLTGGKMDTEWVCKRLDNYKPSWDKDWVINWNPVYESAVLEAWKKYKGKFCGRLLIQFLNSDIVKEHIEELRVDDDLYFALCRRFVKENWFVLDRDRLARCTSINAYLSIISQTSEGITDEEARTLLFQWVATIAAKIKEKHPGLNLDTIFWRYQKQTHRVIYAWGLDTALWYFLKMGKYDVVSEFIEWDQLIFDTYYSRLTSEEDNPENQESFVDVIIEKFPDKYRKLYHLNSEYYQYAYGAGQPFTIPHRYPWHNDKMYNIPMYLEESNEEKSSAEIGIQHEENNPKSLGLFSCEEDIRRLAPYTSEEDLKKMVEACPQLQGLVDSLGLQPISTTEQLIDEW